MSKPFFLTRQTANLMEDFTRELKQGSALFLLYGEIGVGKTRLLHELGESRLSERAIFWLDLDSVDDSDETHLDRSAEVEALFAAAGNGDIIIADHFEMALKKTRHQLFLSWSTDGIDKQLNLVIASSTEGFNELRQLSQQYQTPVQSFQLMPFSADEVKAFLGFYLFPDQPLGKLSIPSPLARQIAATQGIAGRLIEIADREGSQIQSAAPVPNESNRQGGRIILALIGLAVIVLGGGWYLLRQETSLIPPAPASAEAETVGVPETLPEVVADTAPTDQPEAALATQVESTVARSGDAMAEPTAAADAALAAAAAPVDPDPAPESITEAETSAAKIEVAEDSAQVPATAATEPAVQSQTAADEPAQEPSLSRGEPGTASDSEAVIVEAKVIDQAEPSRTAQEDTAIEPPAPPRNSQERFDLELGRSMDWIRQRDDSVGTIQIMLLSHANFDPDNYFEYVADLARQKIDPERLRVFKTYTGNREVYSVVYDEFASRKSAFDAIDSLPAVLRDTGPLARSVGGLWQEIRRLESSN